MRYILMALISFVGGLFIFLAKDSFFWLSLGMLLATINLTKVILSYKLLYSDDEYTKFGLFVENTFNFSIFVFSMILFIVGTVYLCALPYGIFVVGAIMIALMVLFYLFVVSQDEESDNTPTSRVADFIIGGLIDGLFSGW